jgi:hypothetical protein
MWRHAHITLYRQGVIGRKDISHSIMFINVLGFVADENSSTSSAFISKCMFTYFTATT